MKKETKYPGGRGEAFGLRLALAELVQCCRGRVAL
jgi:hypothetical protein